jgi:hypothetical protein
MMVMLLLLFYTQRDVVVTTVLWDIPYNLTTGNCFCNIHRQRERERDEKMIECLTSLVLLDYGRMKIGGEVLPVTPSSMFDLVAQ